MVAKDAAGNDMYLHDGELSYHNSSWDSDGKVKSVLLANHNPYGHVMQIANRLVTATGGMQDFARKVHRDPDLSGYTTLVASATYVYVWYAGEPEPKWEEAAVKLRPNDPESTLAEVRQTVRLCVQALWHLHHFHAHMSVCKMARLHVPPLSNAPLGGDKHAAHCCSRQWYTSKLAMSRQCMRVQSCHPGVINCQMVLTLVVSYRFDISRIKLEIELLQC